MVRHLNNTIARVLTSSASCPTSAATPQIPTQISPSPHIFASIVRHQALLRKITEDSADWYAHKCTMSSSAEWPVLLGNFPSSSSYKGLLSNPPFISCTGYSMSPPCSSHSLFSFLLSDSEKKRKTKRIQIIL